MRPPLKINFDLDDVLSYFTPYILYRLGAKIQPWDYSAYPEGFGWDFVGAANHLIPGAEFTRSSLWEAVTEEMWENVPRAALLPEMLDIAIEAVGKKNIRVITALSPGGVSGKMKWIHKHLPDWLQGQVWLCTGSIKDDCAGPGNLLIDDATHNIDAWNDAGGETIQWPRPWNLEPPMSLAHFDTAVFDWKKNAIAKNTLVHCA